MWDAELATSLCLQGELPWERCGSTKAQGCPDRFVALVCFMLSIFNPNLHLYFNARREDDWRCLTPLSLLSGPCFEGPRGSSIPESVCSHPWLLVGHAQQGTNLVHPQSDPAFPSCSSGAKWLLPPKTCMPACKENILLGCHRLLFTTLVGRSKSASLAFPASPWAQYPAPGEALGIAQPVLWWLLWWHWVLGTGGSMATPAPTGGDASNLSRELSTARGAAFPCSIPSSRRQLGYFPSVSNAVLALCPCQTCSGIPPGGVWRLAMGVPGEDMGYWVWLAPADVSAAGCAGSGG